MIGIDLWLLGALAVLVSISLFGFVGCAAIAGLDEDFKVAPSYDQSIQGESTLVAYWRLGEPIATPVPSTGGTAKSETNRHNGDYQPLGTAPADTARHSPPVGGTPIQLGQKPGLLTKSPDHTGMQSTSGAGYVQIPFADELNTTTFTFEAWLNPDIGDDDNKFPGNYYCIVESTGPAGKDGLGKKSAGFGLYIGPKDVPPKTPPGPYFWQVWMGDGTKLSQVGVSNKPVEFKKTTYLALTFSADTGLQLFVYLPGTKQNLDAMTGQLNVNFPPGFKFRAAVDSQFLGDFFIGSGSNLYPDVPGAPTQRLYPFKGYIQEVAMYNADLSAPNNTGLAKLAGHELSGGDV
jgi:hypothetical protein